MQACIACRASNAEGLVACARCGGALAPALEQRDDVLLREVESAQRTRRTRRLHALAGAMTFFLLNLLLGFPESLLPGALAANALTSTAFGLPIGWFISRQRAGPVQGALISAGTFIAVRLLLGLLEGKGGDALLPALMWGLSGLIPGALIGYHVELDT
jgi:hypothetical protein